MARYSPRDPGFTHVPGVLEGLSSIATAGAQGYQAGKQTKQDEEDRKLKEALNALAGYESGLREGQAPREAVPEEEDIFRGEPVGPAQSGRTEVAPPLFQGVRPGQVAATGLEGALEQLQMDGAPPEPQVVALPGAYVDGMGFAPRAITDQDLVGDTRARAARPRTRTVGGAQQLTEDYYLDPSGTPEARAEQKTIREEGRDTARERRERARLEAALGGVAGMRLPPEQTAELLGEVPGSTLFDNPDPDQIRVGGRLFPNTPAGEAASLAWQESLSDARAQGSGSGGGANTTAEVTRRQFALAASRAIADLQEEFRSMSRRERDRAISEGRSIQENVQAVLDIFGYDSVPELQDEMRTLRLSGGARGAGRSSAPGVGPDQLNDEEIDALIEANPDMSDEEILELINQGR